MADELDRHRCELNETVNHQADLQRNYVEAKISSMSKTVVRAAAHSLQHVSY